MKESENMKHEMIFENQEFGQLRMFILDGKEYFMASDVAKMLGYTNPNKAVNDHCRAITKRYTLISGKEQEVNFIPEGDVYRLIIRSKLPKAEEFEKWVFDKVLPSIRKQGTYIAPEIQEKILSNPDMLIELAAQLKAEKSKRVMLENEIKQKNRIIEIMGSLSNSYEVTLSNVTISGVIQITAKN